MAEGAQSTNSADEKVVDNERSSLTNHLPSPSNGMKTSTAARTVDDRLPLLEEEKKGASSKLEKKLPSQMAAGVENAGNSQEFSNQIAELTARLHEKQAKIDSLEKMNAEEKERTVAATQRTQVVEQRCQELENKLQMEKQTQYFLKKEIERLTPFEDRDPNSLVVSPNITEDIELLKQQLRVYADNFAKEKSCRENIQADRDRLEEELKKWKDKIALLEQQVCIYQHRFNTERNEREALQRQICDQRPASVVQDSRDLHSNVMAKFEELKQQVHMLIQGASNGRTDREHAQAIRELNQELKGCEELIAFLMELLLGPEIIRSAVP